MRKVLLDANFLLIPHQFGVDIKRQIEEILETPHEFVVPTGVIFELKKIARGRGRDGVAARFALKLIDAMHVKKVRSGGPVDDWIVSYAARENAIVCTNDAELRHRLKNEGVKMIALRSRARLGVV